MTTTNLATEPDVTLTTEKTTHFFIEGLALLETMETMPEDMKLKAYVFDPAGHLLGSAPMDAKGRFNVPVHLDHPADVQLFIGPAGEPDDVRKASVYKQTFFAKDWVPEGAGYQLKPRIFVAFHLWNLWRPVTAFVTGHVRTTQGRPIPYLKVEIFDVDREGIFWPYLLNKKDFLLYRKAVDLRELLEEAPRPKPAFLEQVSLNPSPEPPIPELLAEKAMPRVGEMASASTALAEGLDHLTLTSKAAPWDLFVRGFYSKRLVDTVYTDFQGFFHSCFNWMPFHLHRGRLRFDRKPDVIVRVTQMIDGVEKVLYMDPYTSTRWNVMNTHIDLWLDDVEIKAGTGENPVRPAATQAFFTRVGNDEVFDIDQTTGLGKAASPYPNAAYGYVVGLHGQFGDALSTGTPKRYYRMSYRKAGNFVPIATPLTDTRVNKTTMKAETCFLGPFDVNGTPGLYEVRSFAKYYWYNPDWLIDWDTRMETDFGVYTLRLEVFDENGMLLAADYRDGTKATVPATPLPAMTHCDLILAVNNNGPEIDLNIAAPSTGVITWKPNLTIDLKVDLAEKNGRLRTWVLEYVKAFEAPVALFDQTYNAGIPAVAQTSSIPVTSLAITGTCPLAFKLAAWAHVRNGYSFLGFYPYYKEEIQAIAIEKCPNMAVPV